MQSATEMRQILLAYENILTLSFQCLDSKKHNKTTMSF